MEGYAVLLVLVALVGFFPIGLISAMRQPEEAYRAVGRTRAGTILAIFLVGGIGALYYWLRIRPDVRAAAEALPPRPRVPMAERWRE
jgi:hypothetical protein